MTVTAETVLSSPPFIHVLCANAEGLAKLLFSGLSSTKRNVAVLKVRTYVIQVQKLKFFAAKIPHIDINNDNVNIDCLCT